MRNAAWRGDEVGVVKARLRREPVLQREHREALLEAGDVDLARLFGQRVSLRAADPARERGLQDGAFGRARLLPRLPVLRGQGFVDLGGGLVDERPGPEHDLDRARLPELRARPARPALAR